MMWNGEHFATDSNGNSRRISDGRTFCRNCGIAIDVGGGCSQCKPGKGVVRAFAILTALALAGCIFDDPPTYGPSDNAMLYDCHEIAQCGIGRCSIGGNACQEPADCTSSSAGHQDLCDPTQGIPLIDQHLDACLIGTAVGFARDWRDNKAWRAEWLEDIAARTDDALIAAGFHTCDHVNAFIACELYKPRRSCEP